MMDPIVEVSLAQTRAVQQVRGPHLVRQDGTIWLGGHAVTCIEGSLRV